MKGSCIRTGRKLSYVGRTRAFSVEPLESRVLLSTSPPMPLGAPGTPSNFVELGENTFFMTAGRNLYMTNGTDGGTFRLLRFGAISGLTKVGDEMYFATDEGVWKSDGTLSGTVCVLPDPGAVNASNFTELDGTVYFFANIPGSGNGLWKTDGTPEGTGLVRQLSSPTRLNRAGDRLFFAATTSAHGRELWTSDGTAGGTHMVKDVFPGIWGSLPSSPEIVPLADRVLFVAHDGTTASYHPWVSDGTEAGTRRISAARMHLGMTRVGDHVFFAAFDAASNQEIWRSDGTTPGTVRVKMLGFAPAPPSSFTDVNGDAFFVAADASGARNLWTSNGTDAGTFPIHGAATGTPVSNFFNLTRAAGMLAFTVEQDGYSLWTSDGTATGSVKIADTFLPAESGWPGVIGSIGTILLFTANNGSGGAKLWGFQTSDDPPVPQAIAQGPVAYLVDEGATLTLHGYLSSPALPGRPLVYTWDLDGDGIFGETGAAAEQGDEVGTNPAFSAAGLDGPGMHPVQFRISDHTGYVSTASAEIAIRNVPPTLTVAGSATMLAEGTPYTLTFSASDPGPDTISRWTVDWGDGVVEQLPGDATSATHLYPPGYGTYGVLVRAEDEDGSYRAERAVGFDSDFGSNGVVISNQVDRADTPANIALQSDGKIVAVSTLQLSGQSTHKAVSITRYNYDGTLDPTFGVDGRVRFNPLPDMFANGIAIMPDGRIIVSGGAWNGCFLLALLPDGSLDPGFGDGGWRYFDFGSSDTIAALHITDDGKILGAGIGGEGTRRTMVFRFTKDGSLDATFGQGGVVTFTDFVANSRGVYDTLLQSDGKLLIVPFRYGTATDYRVLRINPDGTPDLTFGTSGMATVAFGSAPAVASSVALLPDGRIVVAGRTQTSSGSSTQYTAAVTRLNADGSLDTTFATEGRWQSEQLSSMDHPVVRLQPDGRLLLCYTGQWTQNRYRHLLHRLDPDGARDDTFGSGGTFTVDLDGIGNGALLRTMILQLDGAPLLYAGAGTGQNPSEAIVRLTPPNPSLRVTDAALPVVSLDGDPTTPEGSVYTLQLNAFDPDDDGITQWVVNWGDGAVTVLRGNPSSVSHTYADGPASFSVRASAIDGDGSIVRAVADVTVTNVPPQLGVIGRSIGFWEVPYVVQLSSFDVGPDTIQRWVIDWGDGVMQTLNGNPSTAQHTYLSTGQFTIHAKATDEDGTFDAPPFTVTIRAESPFAREGEPPALPVAASSVFGVDRWPDDDEDDDDNLD